MIPKNTTNSNKGVILLMVLLVILVVVALANIILLLVSSQARLTQHQVGRIQASYAAQAGMNYAIEMLRTNTAGWGPGTTHTMCRSSPPCDIAEAGFPPLPFQVTITIYTLGADPPGPAPPMPGTAPISVNVTYTTPYTPP